MRLITTTEALSAVGTTGSSGIWKAGEISDENSPKGTSPVRPREPGRVEVHCLWWDDFSVDPAFGNYLRQPLLPEPMEPVASRVLRRWQKATIGSLIAALILCCVAGFISEVVFEQSIDPRKTDAYYWNDTDLTVVVRECESDCTELKRVYTLKPDGIKGFTPSSRHPLPTALLVEDTLGNVLGCTRIGTIEGRPSWYFRVSLMDDCSRISLASKVMARDIHNLLAPKA